MVLADAVGLRVNHEHGPRRTVQIDRRHECATVVETPAGAVEGGQVVELLRHLVEVELATAAGDKVNVQAVSRKVGIEQKARVTANASLPG